MSANAPPGSEHRRKPPRKRDKARKLGSPPKAESWCWLTKTMLTSPAWRELLKHRVAHLIVERIILEYLEHAGQDNGRLIVTYEEFAEDCAVRRRSISEGIDIAEALGFLIVHRGRKSAKDRRHPNRYGLTFYPIYEEFESNNWARIKTRAEAESIVARVKAKRGERPSPSIVPGKGEGYVAEKEAIRAGTSGD
jgi:hypothetical protein